MAARAVLAVVAILLLVWLGVTERDVRLQAQALQASRAGRIHPASTELSRARLLNPDPAPELQRSLFALYLGQRQRAATGIEQVLRDEPENLMAWTYLLAIAGGHDPGTARRARAAIARLDPLSARSLGG